MSNVYILSKYYGYDFEDAKRFGDLVFLTETPYSKFSVGKIYAEFAMKLRESSPNDYILLTSGLTTMLAIACACFGFMHGRINLLLYSQGKYVAKTIDLNQFLRKEMGEDEC